MTYGSMEALIDAANHGASPKWFSTGAMRWFDSRIESEVLHGCYFVTSEQEPEWRGKRPPRRYSVRVAGEDGSIETVGEFMEHRTLDAALAAVEEQAS